MITLIAAALIAPCGIPHKHKAHAAAVPMCAMSPLPVMLPAEPEIDPIRLNTLTRYVVLTQQEYVSVNCGNNWFSGLDTGSHNVVGSYSIGRAPEIDPSGAIPALTLMLGCITVFLSNKQR
jgi:hypothetical protein